MALKGKIKISSVNNLSDARYVAGMGVEFMGFNIDPEMSNPLSPTDFAAITGWVSGVQLVGQVEWVDANALHKLREQYEIDLVEVTNPASSDFNDLSLPYAISTGPSTIGELQQILQRFSGAQYYLVNTASFQNPWQDQLASLLSQYPILVGGSLDQQQAIKWLDQGAMGIELEGGDEIKPGYKDFDDLADILEALEVDEAY